MSSSDESSTAGATGGATAKMLLHREINEHPDYKTSRDNNTLKVTFTKVKIRGLTDSNQRWISECTITSPGIETITAAGDVRPNKKEAQQSAAEEMRGLLLAKRFPNGTMIY